MAAVKLTKSELKRQRDALKRFTRYLPTLQLKKQQLQLEARRARRRLDDTQQERDEYVKALKGWIELLDEQSAEELKELIVVRSWRTSERNIAGIDTPVFESLEFDRPAYDLWKTPVWYDDILETVEKMAEYELHLRLLRLQVEALEDELRTTTQRVNLFEKVKIPEARENIRTIQIYLGDEQTNQVGRAKIAKRKTQERVATL